MREYELTFIVQPEISDEGVQALRGRIGEVLTKHAAVPLIFDDQGRRRLAYEIQKFQKGRYVCVNFLDGGKAVPEIERALRLEDSVLRFLTIQIDEEVADIEARKAEAAEQERIRAQKAAERAEREAAEAAERAEREAEETRARDAREARAAEAAEAEAAASSDPAEDASDAEPDDAPEESAEDEPSDDDEKED